MICPNCNATIEDNSTSCPNCGTLFNPNANNNQNNDISNANINNNDDEVVMITENMAPPELVVNQENMTEGTGELSNGDSMSSYAPEEVTETKDDGVDNSKLLERVDFSIPKVTTPEETDAPKDGSVPIIGEQKTILTEDVTPKKDITQLKIGGKVLKFKMGKNLSLPIVLVIGILTLIIGVFIGKMLFSRNYCATPTRKTNTTKVKYVSDGKNNVTNVGSFTYKIPEDYIYDKNLKGVLIYDKKDTFRIYIKTTNGSYEDMSGAKLSIKETLKENGTNVNNIKELNIGDKDYLIIETIRGTSNRLVAFSDASHDYVYYIEIVNSSNNYDYDVLDIAADIVKNATYEEVNSTMEHASINDVSELSIKASLEYKALSNK